MNYKELERANELYREIKDINDVLETIKGYSSDIRVSTRYSLADMDFDKIVYFNGKRKEKILDTLKEIKDEMIKELNELGVTEEI
jgi:hypothetical protein